MTGKHFYIIPFGVVLLLFSLFYTLPFSRNMGFPGPIRTLSKSEWSMLLDSGHKVGPDSAPVTIVEFSDFLCTHCKEFDQVLELYRKDHPGQIKVIYHNFPLRQHSYSLKLAASAECVAKNGDYGTYYSLLYENQDNIRDISLDSLAKIAGVKNAKAFNACMNNPSVLDAINHDVSLGQKIGLMQTPTIVINRVLYSGALTYEQLSEAIDYVSGQSK